jgi:hypothetical protein
MEEETLTPDPAPPQLFRAAALPPLRPAAFFCAVVPPCLSEERNAY